MAAERVQQDGYASSKERRISDSTAPFNKANPQHDGHYSNMPHNQQQQHHHHNHHHGHEHRHHHANDPRHTTYDVSRAEFEQFQQQVSYNYECIQEHKRSMANFESALAYVQRDFTRAIEELRSELRSRNFTPSSAVSSARQDPRDVEVLLTQVTSINTKVNEKVSEIDDVKIKLQLLKTKVERLEADSASHPLQVPPPPRPGSASSFRETQPRSEGPHPHHPHHHGAHQPLPPIQTGPLPADGGRHRGLQSSNTTVDPALRGDRRMPPADQRYPLDHRPGEPLPPPSSLSTWRSAPGPPPPYPGNEATRDVWYHNNHQPSKRPYDEPTAREHSAPASPKRPKLAPLKPRSGYEEAQHPGYPPSENVPYHNAPRPHEGPPPPPPPPPQLLATPASATASGPPYRFITSTLPPEHHENWRADDGHSARARAASRNPVRRGSRPHGEKELDPPAWEHKQLDWHTQPIQGPPPPPPPPPPPSTSQPQHQHQHQLSPNGYIPNGPRPPPVMMRPGENQPEYPLTPIASAVSPHEPALQIHMSDTVIPFGAKKTRTKPVRNSEGVLIRKDGRPDMRSVSSANNLRKVHAKKEAERLDADGRTLMSARPLAASQSVSVSDDDEEEDSRNAVEPSRSATPPRPLVLDEDYEKRRYESAPVTGLVTPAEDKSVVVIDDAKAAAERRTAAKAEEP